MLFVIFIHGVVIYFDLPVTNSSLTNQDFVVSLDIFKYTFHCLFDLILYVYSTIFQFCRDWFFWVEPVLSKDKTQ